MDDARIAESSHGQIKVCVLDGRGDAYIRVAKIAGVLALKPDGPTRILFDAGGHIDVCGGANQWRLIIQIVALGGAQP